MYFQPSKSRQVYSQHIIAIALTQALLLATAQAAPAPTPVTPARNSSEAPAQTAAQITAQRSEGATLARVRSANKLLLGYRPDAQPMSYRDDSGEPAGYAVTLCRQITDDLKTQLQLPTLAVEWVEITAATATQALLQGKIDLLCSPEAPTLSRREQTSFSTPIFLSGIAALVRADAPAEFQRALENRPPPYKPLWRGTPPAALQYTTASVVAGTPAVELLAKGVQALKLIITISTEPNYDAAIAKVVKGQSDVLFGDRAELLAHLKQNRYPQQLKLLTRYFTYEPLALALARDNDYLRLVVDRALAHFFADPQFGELYQTNFGTADADSIAFFRAAPR